MQPTSPVIPALTFSLPDGVSTFLAARSLAAAAQGKIATGDMSGQSADGSALVDTAGNAIGCACNNFAVLDANGDPTIFEFAVMPQGATPNPATDNTPTSMRITFANMQEIAASVADFYQAEAQTPGSGVEAANDGGCNVTDSQNKNWPVTFIADPS